MGLDMYGFSTPLANVKDEISVVNENSQIGRASCRERVLRLV